MKRESPRSVWAFLGVVLVLFICSLAAPRRWRAVSLTPGAAGDAVRSSSAERLLLSPHEVRSLVAEQRTVGTAAQRLAAAAPRLGDFAAPRQVAEIAPRVASSFEPAPKLDAVAPPAVVVEPSLTLPPAGLARLPSTDPVPHWSDNAWSVNRRIAHLDSGMVTHWPHAAALAERVQRLAGRCECAAWAADVLRDLRLLATADSVGVPRVAGALERLRALAQQALDLADASSDEEFCADLARAGYGLTRRLAVWERVAKIGSGPADARSVAIGDAETRRQIIEAVETRLQRVEHRRAWRDYLLVDEAKGRFCSDRPANTGECRTLAKRILLRMEFAALTPAQQTFLRQREFVNYSQALRQLAVEPVDYLRLLDELERYEREGGREHALYLAAAQQVLRWSTVDPIAGLGSALDTHYRNANLRVALSQELINRLMPSPDPRREPVDDLILGVPTWGQSRTTSRLTVTLLPSPRSWRFALETKGQVHSQTLSRSGPATFASEGEAVFHARKQIAIGPGGLSQGSTLVTADSNSTLTGMETNLDDLPLLGGLVRAAAMRRYRENGPAAKYEVENKLAVRVGDTFDREIRKHLARLVQQWEDRFYAPARRLALNPTAREMRTTERQAIARYRLAAYDQLAAHTPRPVAPENSWLSVQIHESALNNTIQQLGWQGRRAGLDELIDEGAQLLGLADWTGPEDLPDNVTVRFAARDPLRVSFQDGHITLSLALAELRQGRKQWRNFAVRVHYRAAPEQPEVDLVRDQYVELMGRLGLRDQVALRGIFSRVFSRAKPIDFISRRLKNDPRLAGLAVTQLVIGDGWIGVAIGPATSVAVADSEEYPTWR